MSGPILGHQASGRIPGRAWRSTRR
jgi:hypothetical protein